MPTRRHHHRGRRCRHWLDARSRVHDLVELARLRAYPRSTEPAEVQAAASRRTGRHRPTSATGDVDGASVHELGMAACSRGARRRARRRRAVAAHHPRDGARSRTSSPATPGVTCGRPDLTLGRERIDRHARQPRHGRPRTPRSRMHASGPAQRAHARGDPRVHPAHGALRRGSRLQRGASPSMRDVFAGMTTTPRDAPMARSSRWTRRSRAPHEAVADIPTARRIAVGGFGLSGVPITLIRALLRRRRDRPRGGVEQLPASTAGASASSSPRGRIRRIDRVVHRREQGVRPAVPRRRGRGRADAAGHAGRAAACRRRRHPGVLHRDRRRHRWCRGRTAAGATPPTAAVAVAEPAEGDPRRSSRSAPPREYVLEQAIRADFGLVRAARATGTATCVFEKSARNFNPLVAMSGRVSIAEVDELVEPGEPRPRRDPPARHLRRPDRSC